MPAVTVSGVSIPVAPGDVNRPRSDLVDRARAFDGTYRASATGTAKRDWNFRTPPITRSAADIFEALLANVGAQNCSGDILGGGSNVALYSEQFDNAAWTKAAVTVTPDVGLAPNGLSVGDKIVETAVTAQHNVNQSITAAVGVAQYSFSVWLTAGERTKAVVSLNDGTTGATSIGVDLTNGSTFASGLAIGSWGGITSAVEGPYQGWYRVRVSGQRGAGTVVSPVIYLWTTALSYLGVVGNGLYAFGAQVEPSATASIYVPTTSVARSTLITSCCTEITGWVPVKTPDGHRVVLSFAVHEV